MLELTGEHSRSGQLTTMAPLSNVAGFKPVPPTHTQRSSHRMMPAVNPPIQDLWSSDLGPLAPVDISTDWRSTSGLIVPSVDSLTTQTPNTGIEVKVSQPGSSCDSHDLFRPSTLSVNTTPPLKLHSIHLSISLQTLLYHLITPKLT